eukprot:TRINITY_DN110517_c0_g1_i1.p1 TRINITY_DN110517_c0_g1~~TRINITY_DN110517_c0_g1_i1.p1  ORF type:complete len:219 (-),score=17.43 TRINITY_DN110517_c0_g1_i1:73-729(-)
MGRRHTEIKDRRGVTEHLQKLLLAEHKIAQACQEYVSKKSRKGKVMVNESFSTNNQTSATSNKSELKLRKVSPLWLKPIKEQLPINAEPTSMFCWNQKKSQRLFEYNTSKRENKRSLSVGRAPIKKSSAFGLKLRKKKLGMDDSTLKETEGEIEEIKKVPSNMIVSFKILPPCKQSAQALLLKARELERCLAVATAKALINKERKGKRFRSVIRPINN